MNRRTRKNYRDDYLTVYIDKREMKDAFDESYQQGFLTERAGELIITLTENIVFSKSIRLNNKPYEVTEALIDSVIMYILENWKRLYSGKPNANPFSYFTAVVRSKTMDFLRTRYGKNKRLDLYGKKLKYRGSFGWKLAETTSL